MKKKKGSKKNKTTGELISDAVSQAKEARENLLKLSKCLKPSWLQDSLIRSAGLLEDATDQFAWLERSLKARELDQHILPNKRG